MKKPSRRFTQAFERVAATRGGLPPEADARVERPTIAHPEVGFDLKCPKHGVYVGYRLMTDDSWRPVDAAAGTPYEDDHGNIAPKCRCGYGAKYKARRVSDALAQLLAYRRANPSAQRLVVEFLDLAKLTRLDTPAEE